MFCKHCGKEIEDEILAYKDEQRSDARNNRTRFI